MIAVVICYEVWLDEPMQQSPAIMGHAFAQVKRFNREHISELLDTVARESMAASEARVSSPLKWAKPRLISVTKLDG